MKVKRRSRLAIWKLWHLRLQMREERFLHSISITAVISECLYWEEIGRLNERVGKSMVLESTQRAKMLPPPHTQPPPLAGETREFAQRIFGARCAVQRSLLECLGKGNVTCIFIRANIEGCGLCVCRERTQELCGKLVMFRGCMANLRDVCGRSGIFSRETL
eukprot:6490485-Amphidinium_carterae.1